VISLAVDDADDAITIQAGWDSKADLPIMSAQYMYTNKHALDALGARLVHFPICLSGFAPDSSVQIVGVIEDVPMRFPTADGGFYIHKEDFVVTPCFFDMLIGWPQWEQWEANVNYRQLTMDLHLPDAPICSVPYTCKHWIVDNPAN
jgi:hypothetical protein